MIPEELASAIRSCITGDIASARSVSGGSINQAAKLTLSDGRECFLKWNRTADPRMFVVEEKGLDLLKSAKTGLRVPEVLATGKTESGTGFLLQEFVKESRSKSDSAKSFGEELAQLHHNHSEKYGLDHHNYIGRLPQSNSWRESWVDFFIEERMQPQLKRAMDDGKLGTDTRSLFEAMYKKLPEIFPDEPPSLLHGDLWGGNYFYDNEGKATIYDPAVYYGHREIELAFTHLFGGFSGGFYREYENAYPLEDNFSERKDIYNLYPLLVHTNLFGGSYGRQVESIVRRFG